MKIGDTVWFFIKSNTEKDLLLSGRIQTVDIDSGKIKVSVSRRKSNENVPSYVVLSELKHVCRSYLNIAFRSKVVALNYKIAFKRIEVRCLLTEYRKALRADIEKDKAKINGRR